MRAFFTQALFVLLIFFQGACAGYRGESPGGADAVSSVELTAVPFFEQDEKQCGPAALATVLLYRGVDSTPESLAGEVFLPGRGGSLQVEIAAAVRRRGLIPSPVRPDLDAVIAELQGGRPVLVLLDLGRGGAPVWHYAVVVGHDPRHGAFVLRSGTREREVMGAGTFDSRWRASGRWGFVVIRPGEIPAAPDKRGYLEAVASLEERGDLSAAEAGYRAALASWPGDEAALLGIGNVRLRRGEPERALEAFRGLLEVHPLSLAGRNNLAHALMELGRLEEAQAVIEEVIAETGGRGDVPEVLLETRAQVEERLRERDGNLPGS